MGLTLWDRIAVPYELYLICSATLIPILHAILAEPTLLLHPKKFKIVLFSNVWNFMAPSVDEGGRDLKQSFIRPNAFGCVLDIGAGQSMSTRTPDACTCSAHVSSNPIQGTAIHSSILIKKRSPAISPWSRMERSTTKFGRQHAKLVLANQTLSYWAMVPNKPRRSSDS